MLKERARIIATGVFALDLLLVVAGAGVAYLARDLLFPALGWADTGLHDVDFYLPLVVVSLPIFGLAFWRFGFYRSHRTERLAIEMWSAAKACLVSGAVLTLLIQLLRLDELILGSERYSRLWLGLFVACAFLLLVMEKSGLRLLARHFRRRGYNFRTVLILGTGPSARTVLKAIEEHRFWGFRVTGFLAVGEPARGSRFDGYPVLGTINDLLQIVDDTPVDEVIFALETFDIADLRRLFAGLEELGINKRLVVGGLLPAGLGGRLSLGELGGLPLLTYSATPVSEVGLLFKRLIDIVVSTLLLVVLSPLLAVIAIAVATSSGGGVLFRQTRAGLNGRRFEMLKFRTMVAGAERLKQNVAHLNELKGPMFKMRRDPRVTPVGRFLRRFSLDELPQLWNVLRGDMSLVGPRPIIPSELCQFERWQRRRLSMRPGLTCLWQIEGRSQAGFEELVQLDLAYIDNWSPFLDLKILCRTVPAVLRGRGAW